MSPFPIIAAQRYGRWGTHPWRTTCRYLAWTGFLGSLLALGSGFLAASGRGLVAADTLWGPFSPGMPSTFRIHEVGGAASLVLSAACLASLYRKRQDFQGIGWLPLLVGLLWAGCALVTAYDGALLRNHPATIQGARSFRTPSRAWNPGAAVPDLTPSSS